METADHQAKKVFLFEDAYVKKWQVCVKFGNYVTTGYIEYPLVTHDPNMLKNKSRGNLVGKIKVSLTERKYQNFR